jgi:gamma-glutamyltranspeptidase/glutathione hydrolase
MLNILETFPLQEYGRYDPRTLHLMTEAMRRAYADRARYLGDPDFVEIPSHLTTKEHARRLAATIVADRATPSREVALDIPLADEGESTTHFSVIDADGMAVANTYTLQNSYGSLVVVRGAGFLLNNEMTDFNWRPGVTDRMGRIGTPANVVAPGKRMLSSQSPTIVTRDGRTVLVTGSPGGRTIPNTVLNVLLNVLEFEMELDAAVAAPRSHHAWFPDVLRVESAAEDRDAATLTQLRNWGHQVEAISGRQGDASPESPTCVAPPQRPSPNKRSGRRCRARNVDSGRLPG